MLAMNVSQVIDLLGGNKPVAELFGVGTSAVSNWRKFNRFPERLHYRLARETERRGINVDPSIFRPTSRASASAAA